MGPFRALFTAPLFILLYFSVWVLILPTAMISAVGRKVGSHHTIRKPILISDEFSERFRDDLSEAMRRGGNRILDFNSIDSLPVSRHFLKKEAIEEVRGVERNLTSGEFVLTFTISVTGALMSFISFTSPKHLPEVVRWQIRPPLTLFSVLTTVIGITILIVVYLRSSLVEHLTYDLRELQVGTTMELFSKMLWNQWVAKNPGSILRAYYLLMFSSLISDGAYQTVLEVFVSAMDPEASKEELLDQFMEDFLDEMGVEVEE